MAEHVAHLEIAPVTPQQWPDLVSLFEQPGPRGGKPDTANCWCVVWRAPWTDPESHRQTLCDIVHAGDEPGLLAYRDGTPVGWVSVAPREQFPTLLRSQFRPRDDDEGVYLVSCFALARQARHQGVGVALLEAAVAHALERGAAAVEGYPAEPPDYKGRLTWFLDYGFAPVRTIGKRTLVRYVPGGAAGAAGP